MIATTTITSQQMDQIGAYLPDDRREDVHNDTAPCAPAEYLAEYAARYGVRDLEEAAELVGLGSVVRRVLHDCLPTAWWHGYDDARCQIPEGGIDSTDGWLGDWTEALVNDTTDRERRRRGLTRQGALAEYNRGAHAAVWEALRRD